MDVGLLVSGGNGRWASRIGLLGLESFVGFGLVKTNLVLGQIGPGNRPTKWVVLGLQKGLTLDPDGP